VYNGHVFYKISKRHMENDMENQKDTENPLSFRGISLKDTQHSQEAKVLDFFTDSDIKRRLFELSKKTEKVVSVLFMISDLLEDHPSLRLSIQEHGVELLSVLYKTYEESRSQCVFMLEKSLVSIECITSFIEMALFLKLVSDMNASILKRELEKLALSLNSLRKEVKTSDKNVRKMFGVTDSIKEDYFNISPEYQNLQSTQDVISQRQRTTKTTQNVANRAVNDTNTASVSFNKNSQHKPTTLKERKELKEDRSLKILSIIQNDMEITCRDIISKFPGYSEKTIQRDLNNLVSHGKLKRHGNKRWTTYTT
jgi:hypothetical protein